MLKGFGCAFIVVLLLSSVALAGSYPQMVGVWDGKTAGYNPDKGFVENTMTFEVLEQKGGVFHGVKSLESIVNGSKMVEKFCGTVTPEGKVMVSEFIDGYMDGHVDGDTMVLQYVEAGPKAKAFIHTFTRRK